jgi:hypothetical protein
VVADSNGHHALDLRTALDLCLSHRSRSLHLFTVLRANETLTAQLDDGQPRPDSSNKRQTRFRKILNRLGLVLFGVLMGALVAEIGLRAVGYSYPQFYAIDPSLGYSLRPNVEGWYRKEGVSYVKINGDGLRDREHAKAKPPDTIRVAVIGDSFTEAMHVEMNQTFWSIAETNLQNCAAFGGKKVEFINFGVSGYGTAQEYLMLHEHVWQYSPDVVLLAVTTNNDVTDNSRALRKANDVPYFVYTDGRLTLDDSFKETETYHVRQSVPSRLVGWVQDHSRLIQALNSANRSFKYWLATRRARRAAATSPRSKGPAPGDEPGIENAVYKQPHDPVWNDAWRVTEGLIAQMRDEATANGAKFVLVTLSHGIQVYPDRQVRQNFMDRYGVSDLFYPDHQFEKICERENVPTIILGPRLQEYAERNKAYLHGFDGDIGNGHWNQLGHRIAGELIAGDLCATGAFLK